LRHWLARQREGESSEATPAASAPPLAINLGIDFGTSFTKVGFRDVGTEEMGLVTFGATTAKDAMIPSVVKISRAGALSLDAPGSAASGQTVIRYLKMRLADVALPDRAVTMPDRIPDVCGFDFNNKEGICALSSWFLATVIVRAQQWVLQHEAMRAKGRTLQWSANIGVPVEYYDSPAIGVFREVLAVAWAWANADDIPAQIKRLLRGTRKWLIAPMLRLLTATLWPRSPQPSNRLSHQDKPYRAFTSTSISVAAHWMALHLISST
jgi:hypothetical protein